MRWWRSRRTRSAEVGGSTAYSTSAAHSLDQLEQVEAKEVRKYSYSQLGREEQVEGSPAVRNLAQQDRLWLMLKEGKSVQRFQMTLTLDQEYEARDSNISKSIGMISII